MSNTPSKKTAPKVVAAKEAKMAKYHMARPGATEGSDGIVYNHAREDFKLKGKNRYRFVCEAPEGVFDHLFPDSDDHTKHVLGKV